MGSFTFSALCVHWLSHSRANRPLSDPLCIHIIICGLDDGLHGTRRFYMDGLAHAPDTVATLRSPHPFAHSVWGLMVLVLVSGSVALFKRRRKAGYTHTHSQGYLFIY